MGFLFLLCVLQPVVVGDNPSACWLWGTVSAVPAPALAESCLQEVVDKGDPGPTPARSATLLSLLPQATVPTGRGPSLRPFVKVLDSKSASWLLSTGNLNVLVQLIKSSLLVWSKS